AGERRLHLVGVERGEGLRQVRLLVNRICRVIDRHEWDVAISVRAGHTSRRSRIAVRRILRGRLVRVAAKLSAPRTHWQVGHRVRAGTEIWGAITYAGVDDRLPRRRQHALAPVLAVLRAWTGAGVAVALHHLQEVRRSGARFDQAFQAALPGDGDALVRDALRLAERDLQVLEFPVHELHQP